MRTVGSERCPRNLYSHRWFITLLVAACVLLVHTTRASRLRRAGATKSRTDLRMLLSQRAGGFFGGMFGKKKAQGSKPAVTDNGKKKKPRVRIKDLYAYHRSDLDPKSPFFIPPSVRTRWKFVRPSRFETGIPLAQSGSEAVSQEEVKQWEGGLPPTQKQGMPADFL